jgi:hypothetical protein
VNDEKYSDGMDSKIVTELAFKNYNKEIKPISKSGDIQQGDESETFEIYDSSEPYNEEF